MDDAQVLHGVFIEVMGIGVLLSGDSGIGKSELALELISRGHALIADDAPIFRPHEGQLLGYCPPLLQDYLEIRGLGLLNIRAMFGETAIRTEMPLDLVIQLSPQPQSPDRIHGSHALRECMGIALQQLSLQVAPGRNLSVLVEAAVRRHILYTNGRDPVREFLQRQQQAMQESPS